MNLAHGGVQLYVDSMPGHQRAESCSDGCGTTHREMHTVRAFKVMNQPVDAGSVERVAAHQQGLN